MKRKVLFVFLIVFSVYSLLFTAVFAESCNPNCGSTEECQKKIDECKKLLEISANSTKPHEQKVADIEKNIASIESNISSIEKQVLQMSKTISIEEENLGERQTQLEAKVRDFFKKTYVRGSDQFLIALVSNTDLGEVLREYSYRQLAINEEKRSITTLVLQLTALGDKKKKLDETQQWLASNKASLQVTLAPIKKLVDDAKKYQSQLSSTVAGLSARQQQLLAEKTGNFSTTVGDVPPADDPASRPDYEPGFRPAFAGFSFGAPHRKGMSQYGAYGRAKSGQNFEEILRSYYPSIELKNDYRTDINVTVSGYGSYNIEEYVKRIYEVPNSWGDNGGYESLKAQAVAARSYALAYTGNGSKAICATEACQVFKPANKGGNWERAVNDTRGKVLVSGGNPYSAWYAASSGGYNTPGGWDTKCGSQSCWTADAYEKIASSPWFYKAWYRPRSGSGSRSHPWLNKDEFADIVNAVLLYQKDKNNISHLSQTDKSNSDTWSKDEVKNRLGGDAINEVTSISVNYSSGGYTSSVVINGRSIDGVDFRTIFNIRAPGEIWLASPLYNFEKK